MFQDFFMMSLIYPLGLFFSVYFSAIFLGLTIWRDKIQRPRALGWSAILLLASLLCVFIAVPLQGAGQFVSASYYQYSSPSMEAFGIVLLLFGLVFMFSLAASFVLFVIAIVPPELRKRPQRKPDRDPDRNPWDD